MRGLDCRVDLAFLLFCWRRNRTRYASFFGFSTSEGCMDQLALLRSIRNNEKSAVGLRIPPGVSPKGLATALYHNTVTTQLVLSGNAQWTLAEFCEVLESLSNSTSLKVLDLSDMALDDDFLPHVSEFVAHSESLVRLDLSHNYFTTDTARELGEAIKGHKTLRVLSVEQCDFSDEPLSAFVDAVGSGSDYPLQRFYCGHNHLSAAAGEKLAKLLLASERATALNSNGNFFPNELMMKLQTHFASNKEKMKARSAAAFGEIGLLLRSAEEINELDALPTLSFLAACLKRDAGVEAVIESPTRART